MPRQFRNNTRHNGVYFVELANGDQTFFVRYKKDRKLIEERAGRKNQGWTAAKANRLRTERLAGKSGSNVEKRAREKEQKESIENRWTFLKIFDEYLASRPDLKGRANDVRRFNSYLEKDFAHKTPEEVTHFDIERLKRGLAKKKLKPATVRHALEVLRRLSNFATKHNLCSGIRFVIEMPKVNNLMTENLTPEEYNRLENLLDEEKDIQAANLLRFALFTGMRRGELFKLKWKDINYNTKIILIRDPKSGLDETIPINEIALSVLDKHPKTESEFVFPGLGGNQRKTTPRPLRRVIKKAGLNNFRPFHGLRHAYASTLASSGKVDLYKLQKLLTHKSPLMTQRYAHLSNDALMEASNVISDLTKSHQNITDLDELKIGKGES
ncbi:MAG: tyrosine-type recombinase/integrase [Alphaproteobacteria bacterium]|jgi:integrase|nr:tyrosine-type recombinase/integrase [Candidatus Neomarinimicrobiota bacterium]MBT4879494.1 tyrosine-type recombinase/integrase [Alphaproteobacteria bacterium]